MVALEVWEAFSHFYCLARMAVQAQRKISSPPVVERWPRREGWERERWDEFSAAAPAPRPELQGCPRLCEAEHWHHFMWEEFSGQPECQEMLCMLWWTFRNMMHLTLVLSGFPMRRMKYTLYPYVVLKTFRFTM